MGLFFGANAGAATAAGSGAYPDIIDFKPGKAEAVEPTVLGSNAGIGPGASEAYPETGNNIGISTNIGTASVGSEVAPADASARLVT